MFRHFFAILVVLTLITSPAFPVLFEFLGDSESPWDFLDYTGEGKVYPTPDHSCPPGYGPRVLHIEGGVVMAMPKGLTLKDGTIVALYRENDPRDNDADGIIMVRAQYGMDLSVEHNVKQKRPHVWLEQDNDAGFQYRVIDAEGNETTLAERSGYGIVTDPWNVSRWIWQKVNLEGNRIRAKYWPAQEPEPDEWALEADYEKPGDRFGVRINSGNIQLAYFAADTHDIRPHTPPAYLLFPLPRATQTKELPFVLFTNAVDPSDESFEVVVHGGGVECARATFDVHVTEGHGRFDLTLASEPEAVDAEGQVIALEKAPPPGVCTVTITSASGAYSAERCFEVRSEAGLEGQFDTVGGQIDRLTDALGTPPKASNPRRPALEVIRDAAQAHLDYAHEHFMAGDVDSAELSMRFALEALSELNGYKGEWLRDIKPDAAIEIAYDPAEDRRGVSDSPKAGHVDAYSKDFLLRFGEPRLEAESFVMGRSYEIVIPWEVEGAPPDRDFAFRVALVSPLGNRVPAVSETSPQTPTSQWRPGTIYEHRVVLDVSPEDPEGKKPLSKPVVLDEWHRVLVSVTDPTTSAHLILGNPPGPQPNRVGSAFLLADVYVSSTPIDIIGSKSQGRIYGFDGTGAGIAGSQPSRIEAKLRNAGGQSIAATALLTVKTETERTLFCDAKEVRVEPGVAAPVAFEWTPDTAGRLTLHLQVIRDGLMVTEAKGVMHVAAPGSHPGGVLATKSNHVEQRGGTFVTPILVSSAKGPFSVIVCAEGRVVGSGRSDKGRPPGDPLRVDAEPWFGYYDILVDLGDFRYDRRLVATVGETVSEDLLVNGEPFIVKGTNVHGMDGGSPERTRSMMRVMRDLGFNTWRGDYPAPWQVEMAYELNTAYTVLAPFSCTSTADIFGRQDGPPMTTSREITRLFVERYKDSAGVLLWNSCNEVGGESIDFLISQYPVYKAFDPYDRPVHYANLYGQDYWQGQNVMGTNVYFGEGQNAASRHPIVERTLDIARTAGIPLIYCEFNSFVGAVQTTGADAMRGLFAWGVDQGMAGGFQYMKGNSDRHPGIFDSGYNTHKIHDDAIIEVFADAKVSLVSATPEAVRLRITNKRRCTLRQMALSTVVSGMELEAVALDDLEPEGVVEVDVDLPWHVPGPSVVVEGALRFVTHFGFKCRVPISVIARL